MPKPIRLFLNNLQVGMCFTGALSNRKGEILLPAYHPIQHEQLDDWRESRFDDVFTQGFLVESLQSFKKILPGYTDPKLAQFLDMYYHSLEVLQSQFSATLTRVDMERLQKIASLWADRLVKEQDPHLYLKVLRYASPDPSLYFFAHALDVSIFSMALLFRTERSTVRLMQIALSGLLFDIGMLKLPEEYRSPDATYTPEMRRELKKHPIYGYQIITQDFKMPAVFGLAALEHHERFDGSGYPRHLSGIRISLYASIIGLADVFTAQIRERTGKSAKEPAEILKDFVATTMSLFGPELIGVFLNFVTIYPVSSLLILSTGETVVVTETFSYSPLRPTVMVLCNADGSRDVSRRIIHLSEEENEHIRITGIFDRNLIDKTEQIHIKPVISYDSPPDQNPNLQYLAPRNSRSNPSSLDDESKEISIHL